MTHTKRFPGVMPESNDRSIEAGEPEEMVMLWIFF